MRNPSSNPKTAIGQGTIGAPTDPIDSFPAFCRRLDPGESQGSVGRIGQYDILEVLGQGASAVVARGFDSKLMRPVAIKILASRFGPIPLSRKALFKEARAAARVRHEHVVQTYAVEEEPHPIIVMEYVEGETLHQRMRRGPIPSAEAALIGRQAAIGLAAAHANGLIHRDIKPANILLEAGVVPTVKIADFGLAKLDDDAGESQSGFVAGTPMYMSPEQADGKPVDFRSDLFSLGSVLYTAVAGKHPFDGPSSLAVMRNVIDDHPKPIRAINPDVHPGLCEVIEKLMAKDPAARFETAMDAADALANYVARRPIRPASRSPRRWLVPVAAAALLTAMAMGHSGYDNARSEPTEIYDETKEWERHVAGLPAPSQFAELLRRLKQLNPQFSEKGAKYNTDATGIYYVHVESMHLADLSPFRGIRSLTDLSIATEWVNGAPMRTATRDLRPLRGLKLRWLELMYTCVTDFSPLRGMPLYHLNIWQSEAKDLSPLAGMPLQWLNCGLSPVQDLSPMCGMPLEFLCVNLNPVTDLSPLAKLRLKTLMISNTNVTEIAPLKDCPIEELHMLGKPPRDRDAMRGMGVKKLYIDFDPARDLDFIRSVPSLVTVNDKPSEEFWIFKNNKR